jgi:hypothetical protein
MTEIVAWPTLSLMTKSLAADMIISRRAVVPE